MATDPASPAVEPNPSTPVRRQIWQLPVFALGVAAAVASWKAFPPQPLSATERHTQTVRSLQLVLERRSSWQEIEAAVSKLTAAERPTDDPRLMFLLGSAHVAMAEQGPADAAPRNWASAHECLGKLDAAKLDAPDQPRFRFRAAKAAAATELGDPATLLAGLDVVPTGDDPGERSRLIADTCLRAVPPDVKRAKGELTAYLTGQTRGSAATLARYKLKLSDLCLASGEADKARKWLKEVGTSAAGDVQAEALCQVAQMAFADREFAEGVRALQTAEQIPNLPTDLRARVRYELGRGLTGKGDGAAAREAFGKAVSDGGPAGVAARVRLAEAFAREPNPVPAVEHLEMIAAGMKSSAEFRNPHVSVADLRAAFEAVVAACRTARDHSAAARAATAYQAVAENGKDRELAAEVQAGWGEVQLASARTSVETVEAKGRLTQASAEFVKLADERTAPQDKAKWLNRAAACYRAAGDTAGMTEVTAKLEALPGASEEVKVGLKLSRAEQLLKEGQFPDALKLLTEASRAGGAVGAKATVKLALAHVNEGMRLAAAKPTEAEGRAMIQLGQDLLAQVANKTPDTPDARGPHEEAVFELGRLQIHPGLPALLNYPEAEMRFRRLMQEYPTGGYADRGGLYLGISLTQLALGAHKGGTAPPDADRKLAEALKLFEGLAQSKDPWVRTHADMRVPYTMLLLSRFDDLPQVCNDLADKHRGQVHELIVLSMLNKGYVKVKRPDLAKGVFERMQKAFIALPDSAFGTEMPEYKRAYWVENWFPTEKR